MNKLETYLNKKSKESGDLDFPGFKLHVHSKGKLVANLSVGTTYKYYDIASLTKIVFTTSVIMGLVEHKKISLKSKVQKILPWYKFANVSVGDLLNHSAGNEWWSPFYKSIDLCLSPEQKFQQMQRFCREAPLSKGDKAVYSDIDFYLLGAIIESVTEKPLLTVWKTYKEEFFKKSHLHFNYGNSPTFKKSDYAPTEKCLWRKKIVQGEVHDENAWAMGGVAPQAGLFGRIEDLSEWGLILREAFRNKKSLASPVIVKSFCKRSMSSSKGDWGYGFMKPSAKGSSAGELFSKDSVGHTGFTGTSLWFDSSRDLLVCILSNRVHLTRKNKGFVRLRPKLHDWTVQYLEGNI